MFDVDYLKDGDEVGRIIRVSFLQADLRALDTIGGDLEVEIEPNVFTDYVLDGEIVTRPDNTATLDGNVLSGLVVGGKLMVRNKAAAYSTTKTYPITSETATLNFPLPGTYLITVTAWPMLEKEFELTI